MSAHVKTHRGTPLSEKVIFAIALILLTGFQLQYLSKEKKEKGESLAIRTGEKVQDFELSLLDTDTVTHLSQLCAEKPVLLLFMMQGCQPCEMQLNNLSREVTAEDKFQVVLVTSDSETWIRKEVKKRKLTFPVILDKDRALTNTFRVHAYPTTVLLGQDRTMLSFRIGYDPSLIFVVKMGLEDKELRRDSD
ncbi:MAG: hypothetical protein A2V67_10925 [Deltaproteobacteria bacterium RBG_13_61_14]|nr:MAG: hypothetical protein A2V67_10925 [Deltaproteobacteria bacterium RBG_13_61_14]